MKKILLIISFTIFNMVFAFAKDASKVTGLELAEYEIPHDIVFYEGNFVLVTELVNGAAKFYKSTDAQTWEVVEQTSEMGVVDGLAVIDEILYGAGYNTLDGHFIVSSSDMINWEKEIIAPHPSESYLSEYAFIDNEYVKVQGENILQEYSEFNTLFIREDYIYKLFPEGVIFHDSYDNPIRQSIDKSQISMKLAELYPDLDRRELITKSDEVYIEAVSEQPRWDWGAAGAIASFGVFYESTISYCPINLLSEEFKPNFQTKIFNHESLEFEEITIDLLSASNQAYYIFKTSNPASYHELYRNLLELHPDSFPGKDFVSFYKNRLVKTENIWCYSSNTTITNSQKSNHQPFDTREELSAKSFYKSDDGNWFHELDLDDELLATYTDAIKQNEAISLGLIQEASEETDGITFYIYKNSYEILLENGEFEPLWSWSFLYEYDETSSYTYTYTYTDELTQSNYDTLPPIEQTLDYSYIAAEESSYRFLNNHLNSYILEKTKDGVNWSDGYYLPYGKAPQKIVSGNGIDLILTIRSFTIDENEYAREAIDYSYFDENNFHTSHHRPFLTRAIIDSSDYDSFTDQYSNFNLSYNDDASIDPYTYLSNIEGDTEIPVYTNLNIIAESGDLEDDTFLYTFPNEEQGFEVLNKSGSWSESAWLDWYYTKYYPWIYTEFNGWQYTVETTYTGKYYFYDANIACWLWVDSNSYPWVYKYGSNEGYYYAHEKDGERLFYSNNTQEVFTETELKE